MDVYGIIEELEQEFDESKNFLWSKKSLVDIQKIAQRIEEIKIGLPSAIKESAYLLSQRDKIIEEAKDKAQEVIDDATKVGEKIIADSKDKAEALVMDSEIVKLAQAESKKIICESKKTCEQIELTTQVSVDKMLKNFEDYLSESLSVVKTNREQLTDFFEKK